MKLSKKQYHTLLTVIQTAGTVYGILGDMIDKRFKKRYNQIEDLENKVLQNAEKFGMEHVVEFFDDRRVLNEDFVNKIISDILEYEEYVFWELLVRKMTKKEIHQMYSKKQLKNMEQMDYLKIFSDLEQKYWKIVEERGIDNLELK